MRTYIIEKTKHGMFAIRAEGDQSPEPLCWRNTRRLAEKMVDHYQRSDLAKYSLEILAALRKAQDLLRDLEAPAHLEDGEALDEEISALLARIDGDA